MKVTFRKTRWYKKNRFLNYIPFFSLMECMSGEHYQKVDIQWIELSWWAHCIDIIFDVPPRDAWHSLSFPKIEWFERWMK